MKERRRKTLREWVAVQPRSRTQREIARELGLTEPQLSNYLNGRTGPSRETALRLARDYGFDLENLLDPDAAKTKAKAS